MRLILDLLQMCCNYRQVVIAISMTVRDVDGKNRAAEIRVYPLETVCEKLILSKLAAIPLK